MGDDIPQFLLVGNKADESAKRAVPVEEGEALGHQLGCPFMEASAKDCFNVDKIFSELAKALRDKVNLSGMTKPDLKDVFTPTFSEQISDGDQGCMC